MLPWLANLGLGGGDGVIVYPRSNTGKITLDGNGRRFIRDDGLQLEGERLFTTRCREGVDPRFQELAFSEAFRELADVLGEGCQGGDGTPALITEDSCGCSRSGSSKDCA